MREIRVDPDLVDDGVVAQPELELGVVLAARSGIGDAVHARELFLGFVLHPVEQRHTVDRLVAKRADESFAGKQLFHLGISSVFTPSRR